MAWDRQCFPPGTNRPAVATDQANFIAEFCGKGLELRHALAKNGRTVGKGSTHNSNLTAKSRRVALQSSHCSLEDRRSNLRILSIIDLGQPTSNHFFRHGQNVSLALLTRDVVFLKERGDHRSDRAGALE